METKYKSLSVSQQHFYNQAKEWISELEFFHTEITFQLLLLDDYFDRLTGDHDSLVKLRLLEKELFSVGSNIFKINLRLQRQISSLDMVASDQVNEHELAIQFNESEDLMKELRMTIRNIKHELYSIIETIIRESKFIAS